MCWLRLLLLLIGCNHHSLHHLHHLAHLLHHHLLLLLLSCSLRLSVARLLHLLHLSSHLLHLRHLRICLRYLLLVWHSSVGGLRLLSLSLFSQSIVEWVIQIVQSSVQVVLHRLELTIIRHGLWHSLHLWLWLCVQGIQIGQQIVCLRLLDRLFLLLLLQLLNLRLLMLLWLLNWSCKITPIIVVILLRLLLLRLR